MFIPAVLVHNFNFPLKNLVMSNKTPCYEVVFFPKTVVCHLANVPW